MPRERDRDRNYDAWSADTPPAPPPSSSLLFSVNEISVGHSIVNTPVSNGTTRPAQQPLQFPFIIWHQQITVRNIRPSRMPPLLLAQPYSLPRPPPHNKARHLHARIKAYTQKYTHVVRVPLHVWHDGIYIMEYNYSSLKPSALVQWR